MPGAKPREREFTHGLAVSHGHPAPLRRIESQDGAPLGFNRLGKRVVHTVNPTWTRWAVIGHRMRSTAEPHTGDIRPWLLRHHMTRLPLLVLRS